MKSAHLPAEGWPEAQFRCFPGSRPVKIRPGRSISGPEALLRNIVYVQGWFVFELQVMALANVKGISQDVARFWFDDRHLGARQLCMICIFYVTLMLCNSASGP